MSSVFFLDDKLGRTVGPDGKILQTINGGKFRRDQKSGINADLSDIECLDTREGYAIGESETLLYTNTGGNVRTAINSKTTHRQKKLYSNGNKCWAVGYGGTILSYQKESSNNDSRPRLKVR